MKQLTVLYILILITIRVWSNPLHIEQVRTIVIDTDCAIDDMRAISLLLSQSGINIKAILLSDGSLSPNDGIEKVMALLHEFNRDTIPVAAGKEIKGLNPPWRQFNRQLSWGRTTGSISPRTDAAGLLYEKLNQEKKTILVCLGPLTNIAQLIRENDSIASKIERIVWYNESVEPLKGFNYECDQPAADFIFETGIRIDVISNLKKEEAVLGPAFNSVLVRANTPLSRALHHVYSQSAVSDLLFQRHFSLCDDLVSVYLTDPELFDMNIITNGSHVRYNRDYGVAAVKEVIEDMIRGSYILGESVVFSEFPKNRELFTYDVRQIVDSAIVRYGLDEWKANVMTDEFHGHLGVFNCRRKDGH